LFDWDLFTNLAMVVGKEQTEILAAATVAKVDPIHVRMKAAFLRDNGFHAGDRNMGGLNGQTGERPNYQSTRYQDHHYESE
jgi:hypothetical protein